jgi:hypothetical protein
VLSPSAADNGENEGGGLDPVILLGSVMFALLSGYILLYALNANALDRYATGFPVRKCPVCQEGHLELEERPYRSVGIPRVRRTVRCDNCRSILREVGRWRWRYTVDPHANQEMFQEYNDSLISESQFLSLAQDMEEDAPVQYLDEEA